MLTILRSAAQTWISKVLLILLGLSFAVWGISGQIMGGVGSNVLTVGDTKVSILEYRLAYDRQINQLSRQFNMPITREQAQAFGIDNQVLAQLLAGAVLDEQAREMRLGLSRDRIAALTAEDTAFSGPDGRFDRTQFEWVLRQVGMTPNDYLRNLEQVAVREQIVEAVSDGLTVPDAFLNATALYRGEDRTVEFVVLPRSIVEPVAAPSEQTLAEYFEENKANYAAPEYRGFSYIKLEPEDIADPSAITDEDVRAEYDRTVSRYTTAERRVIEQLVFANSDEANAALAKMRAGTSFEDVASEQGRSLADIRLGEFTKDQIADAAIADAAFALSQDEVSDVISGTFGPIIVRVTQIAPEAVQPFANVSEEIRRDLAYGEASRVLSDVHDAYEDARAAGEPMAEAAARQRLNVVTVAAVDNAGRTPEGTTLTDLPEADALLREVFDSEVGVENPSLNIGAAGYIFFEVENVTPARDRSLDEVRDQVAQDWTANEATRLLASRAAELQKQLADGADFAELASQINQEVQIQRGVKRQGGNAALGQTGVTAVFGVSRGQTGIAVGAEPDTQLLFRVTEVSQPLDSGPDSIPDDMKQRFAQGISGDLIDQLVAQLQSQYTVTVDRGAIQQALSF